MTKTLKPPTKEAVKAVKELRKHWGRLMEEESQRVRRYIVGDWFGPSLSDYKDAEDITINEMARIVDKAFAKVRT
ncbi:MAG: hypothetical protein HC888_03105 [Candidatus Competibacteraceae bacterium]|nr:hypothetical protein [Candidatus Competibacteraceae bacterium]